MKRFEYLVKQDLPQDAMNDFGKEGWELVEISWNSEDGIAGTSMAYFKRELPSWPEVDG